MFEITGRTDSWSEVLAMGNGNAGDDVVAAVVVVKTLDRCHTCNFVAQLIARQNRKCDVTCRTTL